MVLRVCSVFIDFHGALQLFQHHLLERLSFSHCLFLLHWSRQILGVWVYFRALYSVPVIRMSVFMPNHAALITVTWQYHLKSGRIVPPVFFLFLRIALAIPGLLWLHINFRIICSSSVKNFMSNLLEITLILQIALGSMEQGSASFI